MGLNLIHELLEQGWAVYALHRASSSMDYLGRFPGDRVTRVVADITDAELLLRAMPEGLDAVFHVAASTSMWSRRNAEQTRINVDGTRNVLRAALERSARRFVHTSSIAAYGLHDEPIDESTPSNARSSWINYLRSKALAEDEVRAGIERGLDAVILNPANIIGPYDQASLSAMFYLVHSGKLPGVPPGRASFCHVREVARAHVRAVQRGRTGENYLLGGTDASYLEMVAILGRLSGRAVPQKTTPAWMLRLGAHVSTTVARLRGKRPRFTPEQAVLSSATLFCRCDKAIRELEFRPVPFETMLRDCHEWMVREGRLR